MALWWQPLLRLSQEHLAVVREEGLLSLLEARALELRTQADEMEAEDRTIGRPSSLHVRRLRRRAAHLREARVALEQASR